jgi:four helix bundle protein
LKDFRTLQVWQKAHELTLACYLSTRQFPREEMYGLTSQLRRCSASIAANIAEGYGRYGDPEFHRFLQIAMGSTSELDYHILLSRDLGYLAADRYEQLSSEVMELKRMLVSLTRKVSSDSATGSSKQQATSNKQ